MSRDKKDILPAGDFGTDVGEVLNPLMEMEGQYAFRCVDCSEIFETVMEWAEHALEKHSNGFPGIDPVRKQ